MIANHINGIKPFKIKHNKSRPIIKIPKNTVISKILGRIGSNMKLTLKVVISSKINLIVGFLFINQQFLLYIFIINTNFQC